ncbi:DUF202 domain-containing protein [Pseudomonas sp. TH34]|uniref:YidH family protein n=1 Tax=Pseudomonas sp. TH34 TaxID=2796399 RepID=UPI001914BEE5|nr:DUF202 domain-containing protein [Pseudomonas sp. TH34]MBK5408876.1 DUF202 domain-containing protein [Pseudomonas sp. TH34]
MKLFGSRLNLSRYIPSGGHAPDPRFTLANERTFLAWIRTALALLAGGVAVEAFTSTVLNENGKVLLVCMLLSLSLLVSVWAFWRWLGVERALRHGAELPMPSVIPILSLGCAAVTVVVFALCWRLV